MTKRSRKCRTSSSSTAPSPRVTFAGLGLGGFLPALASSRIRLSASMETFVASSMERAPQLDENLDFVRCPGTRNIEFLQPHRYFVHLLLAQLRQPSGCVRVAQCSTAFAQLINQGVDR